MINIEQFMEGQIEISYSDFIIERKIPHIPEITSKHSAFEYMVTHNIDNISFISIPELEKNDTTYLHKIPHTIDIIDNITITPSTSHVTVLLDNNEYDIINFKEILMICCPFSSITLKIISDEQPTLTYRETILNLQDRRILGRKIVTTDRTLYSQGICQVVQTVLMS